LAQQWDRKSAIFYAEKPEANEKEVKKENQKRRRRVS